MHEVLLTGTPAQQETMRGTILAREDVEITRAESVGRGIQELFIHARPLWVAFDDPEVALPALLDELYKQFPSSNLSIIVLSSAPARFTVRGYIKLVSPLEFDMAAVNEVIARALNLPLRRGVRLPIRLGIKLAQEQDSKMATTTSISPVGMLVETLSALVIGTVYQFRFAGIRGAAGLPVLSVRVLRQEAAAQTDQRLHSYAMEFVDVPKEKMEEILKMIVPA